MPDLEPYIIAATVYDAASQSDLLRWAAGPPGSRYAEAGPSVRDDEALDQEAPAAAPGSPP